MVSFLHDISTKWNLKSCLWFLLFVVFQINILSVSASTMNLGFAPNNSISEKYVQVEIESSSWVEIGLRRVLSKSEAGSGYEVLVDELREAARGVTTADGFLFKGFTVKAPFNIPVQRFGNMSLGRPDFWGPRIGTSKFANRVFGAIKPSWNPLTQYTKGVIPKGTPIKFGVIGPQGWRYPGGSLQFITPSRGVINQSSKIIPR